MQPQPPIAVPSASRGLDPTELQASKETRMVWPWRCALLGAVVVVILGRWLEGQPEVRQPDSPWRFFVLFRTHPERVGVAVGLGLLALLPWRYPRPNLSEGVVEWPKDPSDPGTARPP